MGVVKYSNLSDSHLTPYPALQHRSEYLFSETLSSSERKAIHEVAEHLGMDHLSEGERGTDRQIRVVRVPVAVQLRRLEEVLQLKRALEVCLFCSRY